MNLKKSDKIIAVIGVIILVIAAIGIIFYYEADEPDDNGNEKQTTDLKLHWVKHCEEYTIDDYCSFKSNYNEPLDITEEMGAVLTNAEFRIKWNDDKIQGLLFKRGKDILTADITFGEETISHRSTGSADTTITPSISVYDTPSDEIYEDVNVKDINLVKNSVDKEYDNENCASFNVLVKLSKGEKIGIRPLKLLAFFGDKGNNFKLTVNYTFYTPEFNEITNPPSEEPKDSSYPGTYGRVLRDTSRGRDI